MAQTPKNLVTSLPWKVTRPKNKYNARKTRVDDITFDSIKEAKRYMGLKMLRDMGDVLHFHRQVIFDLPGGVTYRCDFQVFWADGRVTYEDVKGKKTKEFIKTKKMVEALYPVIIQEV